MKQKLLKTITILLIATLAVYMPIAAYIAVHMYDDNAKSADAAVVLGCKSFMDDHISPCIYARIGHAVDLYKHRAVHKLIFSGGNDAGDNANEAETMKSVAVSAGVPAEDILLEKQATDTYENLLYSYRIARENNVNSVVIVTELYHSPRANLLARKFDMPYRISPATNSECWLKYGYLSGCFLKEPVSLVVNWLEGRI